MTFLANEQSLSSGKPIYLLEFTYSGFLTTYTSAQSTVIHGGTTYEPIGYDSTNMFYSQDAFDNELKLTVPLDNEIVQFFRTFVPLHTFWLTIKRLHLDDTDDETAVLWTGRVRGVEFSTATADIVCDPITSILDRKALRYTSQRTCNHTLYGPHCTVSKVSFRRIDDITVITDNVITVPDAASESNGFYLTGYIETTDLTERIMIIDHTGNELTVRYNPQVMAVGTEVFIYAGCDRNATTCNDKFSNIVNFGGIPNIPLRNHFIDGLQ